jgi:hypothetical protein
LYQGGLSKRLNPIRSLSSWQIPFLGLFTKTGKHTKGFQSTTNGIAAWAFFAHLHNMTFDLKTRTFEVAGEEHWYRVRKITKKAVDGVNKALNGAEVQARAAAMEKATEVLETKVAGLTVGQALEASGLDLSAEDKKLIKDEIVPILLEIFSPPTAGNQVAPQ